MSKLGKESLAVAAGRVALIGAVVGVWTLAAEHAWVSRIVLPHPRDVVFEVPVVLQDEVVWQAIRTTLLEIAGASVVAIIGGLLIGTLAGFWGYARIFVEPSLVWLQVVPIIILYPVIILLFGLDSPSKIVFGGVCGLLPIAYSTTRALAYVEPGFIKTGVALGASGWQRINHISLPAARVALIAGMRIGIAMAIVGVLAGQVLGSFGGLGYEITYAAQVFDTARLFALILVTMCVIGLLQALLTALNVLLSGKDAAALIFSRASPGIR